ncbi:lysine biosynthesis protein LysW [Paenibacillus campi]|uniref:lysine biosynthesis protein LysW n=1 Tax=Paenibacillus campi TaxID=3106031 RepID=UPI002AFED04A|nr:lysine biosynthesis protein LysW [Paenibacillus sp. SGZ-1009]
MNCPECDATVSLPEDTRVNEVVTCEACQTELEVLSTTPVIVAVAPEIEEDWGE